MAYKILSKVLSTRQNKVLENCVSEEKSFFVLGGSTIDNALVAYENFHFMNCIRKQKKGDVALKIDISKA